MEDDIVDAIEEEMLEEQRRKEEEENPQPIKIEGSGEKEKFVTASEPEIVTSYKDRLEQVYDNLSNLKLDKLDEQINEVKKELENLIGELEINEAHIRASVVEKIDKQMTEPRDLHYTVKAKPVVVSPAKDPIFTPANIIIIGLILISIALGVFIIASI